MFSALSFLSLMPMLEVLFGEKNTSYEKPEFEGFKNLGNNLEDYFKSD